MEMLGEVGVAFPECVPLPLPPDMQVWGGYLSLPPLSWFDAEKKTHGRLGRTWAFHPGDVAKIHEVGGSGSLIPVCSFCCQCPFLKRSQPKMNCCLIGGRVQMR